ncbi:hypothetical protein [Glycomyces buryatensis]|uniref:Transposase n=1 Tax=Glycomyces buryatensis TaxID=2570927 RepID=A0A4V4HSW7_9ACTN|nr:hypothetical protein [Glycomyces buryatensis]THV43326.1 hypothetical protein FAB82_01205 [Glycomyces buryatensis]
MQVFCGITTDKSDGPPPGQGDTTCAVALVAAGGGLLATDTFGDDPRGWVRLNGLLARQALGSAPVSVAVSGDVDQLAEFASAAGHLVIRSDAAASRSKDALDDAIALARGMATGEVGGQPFAARPEIAVLRPILDTVASASRARHEASEALTCLLRAVFPAALAAWDDPSEASAVAILTRLPQPGALQSISTEDLAADLATVADPGQVAAMAGALTEAIREIGGGDDPAVAPSVSATAEAVSAWDRSLEGLIGLIQAKRPRPETVPAAAPVSAPTFGAAEEAPAEPRRRRRAGTHDTVRLPGDLPDRQSLRALDPASQLHGIVSPAFEETQLEATQVMPEAQPVDGEATSRTQSIRRRRPQPPELPQGEASEILIGQQPPADTGRRHPWQPKEETVGDLQKALADEGDGLLIFGQAKSAWFQRPEGEEEADAETWTLPGDEGWRTARDVNEAPAAEEATTATGLPKRKPQANLVPGSVVDGGDDPGFAEPVDRDPELLAQNTAGYFKGWGRARGGGRAAAAARQAERMASR